MIHPNSFAPWARFAALLSLALAASSPASCTSFDDAVADKGAFDYAEATSICARVLSCPHLAASLRQSIAAPIDDASFSLCLSWLAGPAPAPPLGFSSQRSALRDIASAPSCEAALASLDVRVLGGDDPLCEGGSTDRCTPEGDLIDCHGGRLVRCGSPHFAPGSACLMAGSVGRCAVGTCGIATKILACDGADVAVCEPGVKLSQHIVCGAIGQSCVTTTEVIGLGVLSQGLEICTTQDNPSPTSVCTKNGSTACTPDGSSMVLCQHVVDLEGFPIVGSVEVVFGCEAELGFRCAPGRPGSVPFCARPDADCSPADADEDRCDGDSLAACISGRRVEVDCAAAGGTCERGPSGAGDRCVVQR